MKKIMILVVCLTVLGIGLYVNMNRKNITPEYLIKTGEIIFIYEEIQMKADLSEDDIKLLNEILCNNKLYKANMSCGFSEEVSIKVNGEFYFCIARDGCPTIFWQETGKYFNIREENLSEFHSILEKYGMKFPCV